jgi:hypothetical protein
MWVGCEGTSSVYLRLRILSKYHKRKGEESQKRSRFHRDYSEEI